MGLMRLAGINRVNGGCRILNIVWGLSELVDIKGAVGMSGGWWGLADIKVSKINS